MKNIIFKMKMMVNFLQMEELDVSGALLAMQETRQSLNRIRNDENGINSEVEAACLFAKTLDVNAEAKFRTIHRIFVHPRCLDPNVETQTSMTMAEFYRKDSFVLLDTMIQVLSEKINCLETYFPTIDEVTRLAEQFPWDIPDPDSFLAELEIFNGYCNRVKEENDTTKFCLGDAADLAIICNRENKLFPLVAKIYRLLLISPLILQ